MKKIKLAIACAASVFVINGYSQGQSPQFYKLGGNTPGTGNTFSDRLGFTTQNDLKLITSDMTRMFISKEGYVGIGTENPSERFQVEGNMKASGCIKAQCLDVKSATFSDSIKIGANSLWLGGDNQNTGANNRIYSDNGHLYIQSQSGKLYNTLINANNKGKVGIGTDDPKEKLHVKGITCGNCPIQVPERPFTTYISIEDELQTINGTFIKSERWDVGVSGNSGSFLIRHAAQDYMFTITKDRKVGIGTTTPGALLDVKGIFRITQDAGGYLQLGAYTASDNFGYVTASGQKNGTGLKFQTSPASGNYGVTHMTINNAGNIGVGTEAPEAKFHVSGNILIKPSSMAGGEVSKLTFADPDGGTSAMSIEYLDNGQAGLAIKGGLLRACEIIVQSTWCDFVFDKDYNLPSLAERKEFINQFGHLPYMASEKEVLDNGANVSKAITGLLQNTEEITLYQFEMENKLNKLQEDFNLILTKYSDLAKENELLKKKVEGLEKNKL